MKSFVAPLLLLGLAIALRAGEIHDAARDGNLEKVRAIVNANPTLANARDRGTTPLHEAARAGHLSVVKFLVDKGANLNTADVVGMTPLRLAVGYHRNEVAEFLKQRGALDKAPPAKAAVPPGAIATAKLPEPSALPEGSMTPRMATNRAPVPTAANAPAPKLAQTNQPPAITNAANDPDMLRVIYPIHEAARVGDADQIKFLLKRFPDLIDATDEKGMTPLHMAAANKKLAAAQTLIGFRAKVNARSDTSQTPLHLAARAGDLSIVQLLLTNRADVNARDSLDATPLLAATQPGEKEEFQATDLTAGARFNAGQRRAAASAMHQQQLALARAIVSRGADVNARNRVGANALMQAVRLRNDGLVDFLLRSGADANAVDMNGRIAPLHLAAGRGLTNIVVLLLNAKASINLADSRGETALGYALHEGHRGVASVLKQRGANIGASRALSTTEQSLVNFFQRTEAAMAGASPADRSRLLLEITATRADAQKILPRHAEVAGRVMEAIRQQIKATKPTGDSEQGKEIWRVKTEPPSIQAQDWITRGWIAREVPVFSLVVDRLGSTSRPGDYCFVNQHWVLLPPLDIIAAQQSAALK